MKKTKIEWCDSTWNPVTGCLRGCEYCYARRIATRFGGLAPDSECHELDDPNKTTQGTADPYPFGFAPTFHRYRLGIPKREKKPKDIFVCSMADLFGEWVPDEWIEEVFAACEAAPQHRYLFLTKNPSRYSDLYNKGIMPKGVNAWNKWYGCSITRPEDEFFWIDELHYGVKHFGFLSIEPIMADFPAYVKGFFDCIHWIIIGAETGNRKGKVVPKKSWVDHICEAADKAKIPVFMKDSLLPVMGEKDMRREFPQGGEAAGEGGEGNGANP